MQTAVNGFEKTGIYPINPDIFPEWMYAPAETTDISNKPDLPNANTDQIEQLETEQFQNIDCEILSVNTKDVNENISTISIGKNPGTSGTQNISIQMYDTKGTPTSAKSNGFSQKSLISYQLQR